MKIRVKLMGMLKEFTPDGGIIDLAEDATVEELLRTLKIDPASIQAVTRNGSIERDRGLNLQEGDDIIILPPVGGG